MDGTHGQSDGNLEDRIRRMALVNNNNSYANVNELDITPRVRLPPSQAAQPPHFPPPMSSSHQRDGSWHQGPPHPAPPVFQQHAYPQGYPGYYPPPQQLVHPHMYHQPYYQGPQVYGPPPHFNHDPAFQGQPAPQAPYVTPGSRGSRRGRGNPDNPRYQRLQLDPDAFQRGGPGAQSPRHLFNPHPGHESPRFPHNEVRERQAEYLNDIATRERSVSEMTKAERDEKEAFRKELEKLSHEVCEANSNLPKVSLECFGSFQSGFATAGSDMDLVIVVEDGKSNAACFSLLENDLPRELEKALLRKGHGAHLLTKTRVPIIKVCQDPGSSLLSRLRAEREKWDFLPNEKKYPHLYPEGDDEGPTGDDLAAPTTAHADEKAATKSPGANGSKKSVASASADHDGAPAETTKEASTTAAETTAANATNQTKPPTQSREQTKGWTRERKAGPLDFPKDGVGIQCDINFFNPLGLHNTQLLRCYSLCDPRVRPIVLFVKSWAKTRRINSSYSGTLSSYGYVMMVLHYLMNVARPPVIPNLQMPERPSRNYSPAGAHRAKVDEWVVDFWRSEDQIEHAVKSGLMTDNKQSVGSLLAGFFQYYSGLGNGPVFRWMTHVLSLRTPGGLLTKEEKGWVKATTEENDGRRVQNRYLFCIEDPFELSHNVARTVTHNGIVAIRDEFRRAQKILHDVGVGVRPILGGLLDPMMEAQDLTDAAKALEHRVRISRDTKGPPEQKVTRIYQDKPQQQTQNGWGNGPIAGSREKAPAKPLDVGDQNAFPALGPASKSNDSKRKKANGQKEGQGFASIDGKKAKAYLDDFRRKKAEDQAEHTAMGAAEAVLNDDN